MDRPDRRFTAATALLATAVASGAAAGFAAGAFIWCVERGVELVWSDIPEALGIDDPLDSWWLWAIPLLGGLLVGLGQRYLGDHPEPMERVMAGWRDGRGVDPRTIPATVANSASALLAGGPVGFEAALVGLLGGIATLIGRWIRGVGRLVREAWGAERIDALPRAARHLPYWVVALSGLAAYRVSPIGQVEVTHRFDAAHDGFGAGDVTAVAVFAALVAIPVAWAAWSIHRAEAMRIHRRAPVLVAMAGGAAFATLAAVDGFVLFSGQHELQDLVGHDNGHLLYLAVAKWLALAIALATGWRGGPIFPTFLAAAALAVVAADLTGAAPDAVMVAAVAAVSVVFLRGSIPMGAVLSLYVAPLTYAGVILVAAVAAAAALALGRAAGALPPATHASP